MKKLANLFFTLAFIIFAMNGIAQNVRQQNETEIYKIVKDIPVFPGCENELDWEKKYSCNEDAIFNHIKKNLKYPSDAKENGHSGAIYVSFIVNTKGGVEHIKITKGLSYAPSLEAEVLRVVKTLPQMIFGEKKGRAVAVKYTQIVRFGADEEPTLTKIDATIEETKKERRKRLRLEKRSGRKAK